MSAAPPIAKTRATHNKAFACPPANPAARPKPTIATPHTTIAITTASPCRWTRGSQPENTPPATAPNAMAADRYAIGAAKPHLEEPRAVPVGGIFARRNVATIGAAHVTASIKYSVDSRLSTTQTLSRPSAACTQSSTDETASPMDAMTSNGLRSIASAHAPPHRPKTTRGTSAKMPESPT